MIKGLLVGINDGVIDFSDACPNEAGTLADGCNLPVAVVLDVDEDGVIDDDDCPNFDPNVVVDENGCEEILGTQGTQGRTSDPMCGACGSVGMISWTMMFIGFVGMKRRLVWRG